MTIASIIRDTRPPPPLALLESYAPIFEPADDLGAWVNRTFIEEFGVLVNERHSHLRHAEIGWLWTNAEHFERNRQAAGVCRMIGPTQKKWGRQLADFHLSQMFGMVPDFVITISVPIAATIDDWSFCALIEHELSHAAQDVSLDGEPRFTKDGNPIFRMVGHDVEEFVDVVARYGADATGTRPLVTAANAGATVGQAQIALACGTCAAMRRA